MNKLGAILLVLLLSSCAVGRASAPTAASDSPTLNSSPAATIIETNSPPTALSTEFAPAEGTAVEATMPVMQADQVKPQPGDAQLARGTVFVDLTGVRASPDQPETVLIASKGSLPTPCHALRAQTHLLDANNRIALDIYSVFDSNRMCAQMIVLFNLIVPVSGLSTDREYTVTVNGQDMLRFHWPLP